LQAQPAAPAEPPAPTAPTELNSSMDDILLSDKRGLLAPSKLAKKLVDTHDFDLHINLELNTPMPSMPILF
jgi:hypothetical protein